MVVTLAQAAEILFHGHQLRVVVSVSVSSYSRTLIVSSMSQLRTISNMIDLSAGGISTTSRTEEASERLIEAPRLSAFVGDILLVPAFPPKSLQPASQPHPFHTIAASRKESLGMLKNLLYMHPLYSTAYHHRPFLRHYTKRCPQLIDFILFYFFVPHVAWVKMCIKWIWTVPPCIATSPRGMMQKKLDGER